LVRQDIDELRAIERNQRARPPSHLLGQPVKRQARSPLINPDKYG
jgi:hypothetical protein